MDTGDSAQADAIQTEMITPADHKVSPEIYRTLAKKVSDNEALTSDDYNAMLDYVLVMGTKMSEAMKKADIRNLISSSRPSRMLRLPTNSTKASSTKPSSSRNS